MDGYTWTMTRYDQLSNNDYRAWTLTSNGNIRDNYFTFEHALRPVFYFESGVQYTGVGDGSEA